MLDHQILFVGLHGTTYFLSLKLVRDLVVQSEVQAYWTLSFFGFPLLQAHDTQACQQYNIPKYKIIFRNCRILGARLKSVDYKHTFTTNASILCAYTHSYIMSQSILILSGILAQRLEAWPDKRSQYQRQHCVC